MTKDELIAEMVSRIVQVEDTPQQKVVRYREIEAAVESAGHYAVPCWLLVRGAEGGELVAFMEQLEAFVEAAPKASERPKRKPSRFGTVVGRSTYVKGL